MKQRVFERQFWKEDSKRHCIRELPHQTGLMRKGCESHEHFDVFMVLAFLISQAFHGHLGKKKGLGL